MDQLATWYGARCNSFFLHRGMKVGLGPGHIALDGDPAPPPKGAQPSQFSAHVCCGETAGWIKMLLDRTVGLGPRHIVLDGNPAPPKRDTAPIFGSCLLWPNGWMDQDATTEVAIGPGIIVLDGDPPSLRPQKGHSSPIIGPCLLWPNGRPSQLLLNTCLNI